MLYTLCNRIFYFSTMKKNYQTPQTTHYYLHTETMLASSPYLHPELGGDQLSNQQSAWDASQWSTDED